MTTGNKTGVSLLQGTAFVQMNNGSGTYTSPAGGSLVTTIGRSWVGVDDLEFQKKIALKQSATNMYTLNVVKNIYARSARSRVIGSPGNSLQYKETIHTTYGEDTNTANWDAAAVTNNTNAAMAKCYKKLDKMRNAYGGLEILGEFRSTLHMLKHPAESLANYANDRAERLIKQKIQSANRINNLKRSKKLSKRQRDKRINRELVDLNKVINSSVLELNFGALPLLGAIADAAQASLEVFPKEGAIKIITSTSKSTVKSSRFNSAGFGFNVGYTQYIEEEYEYEVKIVVRVIYRGQYDGMDSLQLLAAKGGFDFSQVIPVLWELAPLSVFVDMFVNVGDTLTASMTETRNVVSVDRYVVRKLLRRRVIVLTKPSWGSIDITYHRDGSVVTYFKQYTREKWVMSIPPLAFTTPAGNIGQLTNLLAFVNLALFN